MRSSERCLSHSTITGACRRRPEPRDAGGRGVRVAPAAPTGRALDAADRLPDRPLDRATSRRVRGDDDYRNRCGRHCAGHGTDSERARGDVVRVRLHPRGVRVTGRVRPAVAQRLPEAGGRYRARGPVPDGRRGRLHRRIHRPPRRLADPADVRRPRPRHGALSPQLPQRRPRRDRYARRGTRRADPRARRRGPADESTARIDE